MRARWSSAITPHLANDADVGKAGRALALALLTLLAATVAGLEGHASLEAARAGRAAESIGIETTGSASSHVIQVGAAYGVYRRWYEELQRAAWASSEVVKAQSEAERASWETLQRAAAEVAAWVKTQSPLLQPPIYDPVTGLSDFPAFEAITVLEPAVLATERRAAELEVAGQWGGRAASYVTALTVIAVGLFFVGLASTVAVGRRLLAGLGVAFGIGAALWAVAVAMPPLERTPDEAIRHLAAANAALGRAPQLTSTPEISPTQLAWYQTAIDEATAALTLDPEYDTAYQARGAVRVVYAGTLILAGADVGVDPQALLRDGMVDYRRYLEAKPQDYSAWWNLGWAAYLAGDDAASVEATDRALDLAPGQFTLYLNRSLARVGLGDRTGADADVARALELAAADTTDTASWYLSASDFDLGRLAELRPEAADALMSTQLRLREAQAALRSLGRPIPDPAAPAPEAVTVRAIDIGRYSGGAITPGAVIEDGATLASTDAVGVRVTITGEDLVDRHVSARIWIEDLPHPEFTTDLVPSEASTSIDLLSPYGRAGFDLQVGTYAIDVYVDGSRRFHATWTVTPRPDRPSFEITAPALIAELESDAFTCTPDAPAEDGRIVTRCLGSNGERRFFVNVTTDALGRLTSIAMTARTPGAVDPPAAQGRLLFRYVVAMLYPDELEDRALDWIDDQDTAVNDLELGGSTLRVFGANDTERSMDIHAVWTGGETAP